jgi:hypothetical protein
MAVEFGNGAGTWGFHLDLGGSPGTLFSFRLNGNVGRCDFDGTARPSDNAWHHWAILVDLTKSSNEVDAVYIDGSTAAGSYSNNNNNSSLSSSNLTLYLMSRTGSSLFVGGSMAEFAIWGGLLLPAAEIGNLALGVSPRLVQPASLIKHHPLFGGSTAEPDLISGTNMTCTGAVYDDHPRTIQPSTGTRILNLPEPLHHVRGLTRNVAGQKIGVQMVSLGTGAAFTGTVTVYVTGNALTQAIGTVGSGVCTHEGNGYHTYAPSQAETAYGLVAFTFVASGALTQTVQVYTKPGGA